MSVKFNDIRKKIKANDAKGLAITYTPELFRVVKVIIPRKTTLERKRYLLQNADGDYIRSKTNIPHQFYASDLASQMQTICYINVGCLKIIFLKC